MVKNFFLSFSYWCVEVYAPFLSNAIITSAQIAMTYSAQLLGNALSINRFFAIFLDGMFYRYAERLAVPHALLAWAFPVALFCGAIGNLYNSRQHFTCYGGLHWDPLNYTNLIFYTWATIMFQFLARLDYFMYAVLALSLVLDLSTFFKLRKFVLHANDRKRSDRKVALIVTHAITGIFFIGNFLTNTLLHRRETLTPVQEYIINEGAPVIGHIAYTLVVTLFNRPTKRSGYETEKLYNPLQKFTCYGGLHWDPQNYTNNILYSWNSFIFDIVIMNIDYVMAGVLVFSLILDLVTLFRLRNFVQRGDKKRRADRKLTVMLIVTHIITAIFLIGNSITRYLRPTLVLTPVLTYICNEGAPVIGHIIFTLVVTYFNRNPRENSKNPKIISVTESGRDQSSPRK
ncbi:unnamed protein product, partial [Mesorhabditis spiculigera]